MSAPSQEQRPLDFFISHSTKDRNWAEWITGVLEEAGYTAYLSERDLRAGAKVRNSLEGALFLAGRVLVLLSPDYFRSKGLQEASLAFGRQQDGAPNRLTPIRIRDCKPEGFLNELQWLELVGTTENEAKARLLREFPAKGIGRINSCPFPGPEVRSRQTAKTQPLAPRATLRQESIRLHNASDATSTVDTLGFEPYVAALAGFLTDSGTQAPLTVSVEGSWGSGKSSFMRQLEERLKEHGPVVRFSAWLHDKDESVWASFALAFVSAVRSKLPRRKRLWRDATLTRMRFKWGKAGAAFGFALAAAALAFLGVLTLLLVSLFNVEIPGAILARLHLPAPSGVGSWLTTGLLGSLVLLGAPALAIYGMIRAPIEKALTAGFSKPSYTSQVAFVVQFHEDFGKVVQAYVGKDVGSRVYVLVDDLDRCAVPRAAEIMQAINLMIADNPHLVFILGMDREKVAAGLAVKHEDLLPYLSSSFAHPGGLADPAARRLIGIHYGYEYIEKFVQVPFRIPQPSPVHLRTFIDGLTAQRPAPNPVDSTANRSPKRRLLASSSGRASAEPAAATATPSSSAATPPAERAAILRRIEAVQLAYGLDSRIVGDMMEMAAPFLDHNPRRLKQFLNLFRLRMFLAGATGLFHDIEHPEQGRQRSALSPEQVAKFVAICIKWPLFVADLEQEFALLSDLETLAVTGSPPTELQRPEASLRKALFDRWKGRSDLLAFLQLGCIPDGKAPAPYSFQNVPMKALLETAPRAEPTPLEKTKEDQLVEAKELRLQAGQLLRKREFGQAAEFFGRAMAISDRIGDPSGRMDALAGLATAASLKGHLTTATKLRMERLLLAKEMRRGAIIAEEHSKLGDLFLQMKDVPAAIEQFMAALQLFESFGDVSNQASVRDRLEEAYRVQGKVKRSEE